MDFSLTANDNSSPFLPQMDALEAQTGAVPENPVPPDPDLVLADVSQIDGTLVLPNEILLEVFLRHLDGTDIVTCSSVCRHWRRLIRNLPQYPLIRSLTLVNSCMSRTQFCTVIGMNDPQVTRCSKKEILTRPFMTKKVLVCLGKKKAYSSPVCPLRQEAGKMIHLLLGTGAEFEQLNVVKQLIERRCFGAVTMACKDLSGRPGFKQAKIEALLPEMIKELAAAGKVERVRILLLRVPEGTRALVERFIPEWETSDAQEMGKIRYQESIDNGTLELDDVELGSIKDHPTLGMDEFCRLAKAYVSNSDIERSKIIIHQLFEYDAWVSYENLDLVGELCEICLEVDALREEASAMLELFSYVLDIKDRELALERGYFDEKDKDSDWIQKENKLMQLYAQAGNQEKSLALKHNQDGYCLNRSKSMQAFIKGVLRRGDLTCAREMCYLQRDLDDSESLSVMLDGIEEILKHDSNAADDLILEVRDSFFAVYSGDDPYYVFSVDAQAIRILRAMHTAGLDEEVPHFLEWYEQQLLGPSLSKGDPSDILELASALLSIGEVENGMKYIYIQKERARQKSTPAETVARLSEVVSKQVELNFLEEALETYTEILAIAKSARLQYLPWSLKDAVFKIASSTLV